MLTFILATAMRLPLRLRTGLVAAIALTISLVVAAPASAQLVAVTGATVIDGTGRPEVAARCNSRRPPNGSTPVASS
jgi:hypothetical protein